MIQKVLIFLLINFGALGLGALFTVKGVPSEWYINLNKAPWTPPGWVFGFVWTLIMVCFSFYMSYLWPEIENKKILILLFSMNWILNVFWNPIFFYYKNIFLAMIIIVCLTLLVLYFTLIYWNISESKSILIMPYLVWLIIASSLNGYILFKN